MLLCLLLMTLMPLGQSVPIQCNTNFRDLKADVIEVLCPEGCLHQEVAVWGTDIYTDDSSVCKAAIHTGNLKNSGGRVRAEKRPGQDSYHQSLRNGVTTRSYGAWHGSFIIISDNNAISPKSTPQTSPVLVQCNTQALQLTGSKTEVLCPAECLTQGTTVWGTEIYTYDSSICRAAINAGKITNAGGKVTVEKRPGQNSYQESTRNGVTTRSYGAYPVSFILTSETIAIPPTSPSHTPIVPVQCNTQARQLNDSKTIVLCPEGCLLHGSTVWGTEIYTDDHAEAQCKSCKLFWSKTAKDRKTKCLAHHAIQAESTIDIKGSLRQRQHRRLQ
ncbi:cysteine-rich secretory protein LCCL domain-containing 2-like [Ambystoma mexicanum]|uniref:cysteine-rich secretory protein LCCL domain-containing 2-like n=1 Tax=Ambystoma mexicanum TaxID=8296 RepID=UPI0037E8E2A4